MRKYIASALCASLALALFAACGDVSERRGYYEEYEEEGYNSYPLSAGEEQVYNEGEDYNYKSRYEGMSELELLGEMEKTVEEMEELIYLRGDLEGAKKLGQERGEEISRAYRKRRNQRLGYEE